MRKELLAVRRGEMDGVLISAGNTRLPGNWETMVHQAQSRQDMGIEFTDAHAATAARWFRDLHSDFTRLAFGERVSYGDAREAIYYARLAAQGNPNATPRQENEQLLVLDMLATWALNGPEA